MKKRKILHALTYAVLTLGALLVFFPFYLDVYKRQIYNILVIIY